jgi:DNA processing protein
MSSTQLKNRKLASDLAAKGLILLEFPVGSHRISPKLSDSNRIIISGMSVGVRVVEGAQYNGSAITAKLAMDQRRRCLPFRVNITSKPGGGRTC